jgi:hypothetical protein
MAGEMQYNVKPAPEWSRDPAMFQWLSARLIEIRDAGHEFGADSHDVLPDEGNGAEPAQLLRPKEPPGEGEVSLSPPAERRTEYLGALALAA